MSSEIEARLSYLGFQLIMPSPVLRPYIVSYWVMRREKSLTGYREEFMHALGGFGVVFNMGDNVRLNQQLVTDAVFLDGANSQSHRMGFEGRVSLLGIRFRVGAAYPFLGIPLVEMVNQTSLLDWLGAGQILPVYERIANSVSLREQINHLESWLLQRLAQGKTADRLVWNSLGQIQQQNGLLSMETLAQDLNISQRQLERLYQTQVGVTPKLYARLLRVESARQALKQNTEFSLTDLGLRLGFYDQSHFIREFKAIIGMTPGGYIEHSQAQLVSPP
jgi:AraC-like DNA-binding protein